MMRILPLFRRMRQFMSRSVSRSMPRPTARLGGLHLGGLHLGGVWALLLGTTILPSGCAMDEEAISKPAPILYYEAQALEDQGLINEASTAYGELLVQAPGSIWGIHAHLKLGDLKRAISLWEEAETHYRQFLLLDPESEFSAYALYHLLALLERRGRTGLFFASREIDRDMRANQELLLGYRRFILLHPKSRYRSEVDRFYRLARQTLAAHENMVGDYYFDRSHYHAAAERYRYLLRTYPQESDTQKIAAKLLEAYQRNGDRVQAELWQRLLATRHPYHQLREAEAAPPSSSRSVPRSNAAPAGVTSPEPPQVPALDRSAPTTAKRP